MRAPIRMVALIPTHRRKDLVRHTLKSIEQSRLPTSLTSVRVIENGEKDGTEEVVRAFEDTIKAEYLYSPLGNKSAALNQALQDLHDEFVIFLDDDIRVSKELFIAYREVARAPAGSSFFGGPVSCDYEKAPPEWLLQFLPPSVRGWQSKNGEGISREMAFLGCNWAAFAKDIKTLGGFNTDVGPGGRLGASGQESDMQRRLQLAGLKPHYVPDALVWHYVPESNCTPEWTLRRIYRYATESGLKLPKGNRSVFGLPPWAIRTVTLRYMAYLQSLTSANTERRFLARYKLAESLGVINGLRKKP